MLLGTLRRLRALASLLTALPVGPSTLEDAAKAFYMVPFIGLLEGILLSSTFLLSLLLDLNPVVSGAIFALAYVLLTRGLHIDGFSDYFDVIGSMAKGDRAVLILKDPRRGSFGVMALTLNLILTTALAAQFYELLKAPGFKGDFIVFSTIALSYVFSAESLYLVLFYSREEPYNGMARVFSVEAKRRGLRDNIMMLILASLAPSALLFLYAGPLRASLLILSIASSTAASVTFTIRDSASRLGYANGDVAGFSYELSRLSTLTISLVVLGL